MNLAFDYLFRFHKFYFLRMGNFEAKKYAGYKLIKYIYWCMN